MIDPEECAVTLVLGETRVGKTHQNKIEAQKYIHADPATGRPARNVLSLDVRGDYNEMETLLPTPENIDAFTYQKKIEARRILARNQDGTPMKKSEIMAVLELIVLKFRNGLMIFDDPDKYATHSTDQDVVGALTGVAHLGCDVLMSHQSWRKISTTEADNTTIIRLHKTADTPDSMSASKQDALDYELCSIADIIVKGQNQWAEDAYSQNKITKPEWLERKSFYLFLDTRKHQMWPISDIDAFHQAAALFFTSRQPALLREELIKMEMENIISEKEAKKPSKEIRDQAIMRLTRQRYHMLRHSSNSALQF